MNDETLCFYNENGSYCPLSDHDHAEWVASEIYEVVADALGGTLEIEVYTPPYENLRLGVEFHRAGGTLVLHFVPPGEPEEDALLVGIEFGRADKAGKPIRSGFDAAAWRADPDTPFSSGIFMANFDETWRVITMLGITLQIKDIRLSYGGYT